VYTVLNENPEILFTLFKTNTESLFYSHSYRYSLHCRQSSFSPFFLRAII